MLSQINAQVTMLASRNAEKEQLYQELERVKEANVDLEAELAISSNKPSKIDRRSRSSRSSPYADFEDRIASLEDELAAYQDKLSTVSLEMERKEAEIEELLNDGDARDHQHTNEIQKLQEEWTVQTEDLRNERNEIEQVSITFEMNCIKGMLNGLPLAIGG